jgi:hypothetical protein
VGIAGEEAGRRGDEAGVVGGEPSARGGDAAVLAGEAVDALPVPGPPPASRRAAAGLPLVADPAGLCYGEAIREAGRILIPVARVRADAGQVEAVPVGVLDVGPAGARFRSIPGARGGDRASRAGAAALAAIAAAVGAAALTRRRRGRRTWPPRSRRW